jgi:tetratricopeptide (TPR) repeat protein
MKKIIVTCLLLGTLLGCRTSRPVDTSSIQAQFESLRSTFTDAVETGRLEALSSPQYLSDLYHFQQHYQQYRQAYFLPQDSAARRNNEALIAILRNDLGRAEALLGPLSRTQHAAATYNLALLRLLTQRYAAADSLLAQQTVSDQQPYNQVVSWALQGRLAEAVQGADKLPVKPDDKWLYNRGLLYFRQGKSYKAEPFWDAAIGRYPQKATYRVARSQLYWQNQEIYRALEDLRKATEEEYSLAGHRAWVQLGNAQLALQDYQAAEESFRRYKNGLLRPSTFSANFGLANACYGQGRYAEAVEHFRLAVASDSRVSLAQAGLGHALLAQKQYPAAFFAYRKALLGDSLNVHALLGKAVVSTMINRPKEALVDFKKAEKLFDKNNNLLANLFTTRGLAYEQVGQKGHAINDFELAIRLDSSSYVPFAALSSIYLDAEQYGSAGQYLSRAIARQPNDDKMRTNRGNIYLHFNQFDRAEVDFRRAILFNKKNLNAYNGLGITWLEKDQLPQALVLYDSLVRRQPGKPFLWNNRGIVKAYTGQKLDLEYDGREADRYYQGSMQDFEKAQRLDISRQFYAVNKGNIFKNQQDFDQAKNHYERHLSKSSISNLSVLMADHNRQRDSEYYLGVAMQLDSSSSVFRYNQAFLKKKFQQTFTVSQRNDRPVELPEDFARSISRKYSTDGFITIYLYDKQYDRYDYQLQHTMPGLSEHVDELTYLPEYDFVWEAFSRSEPDPHINVQMRTGRSKRWKPRRPSRRATIRCTE